MDPLRVICALKSRDNRASCSYDRLCRRGPRRKLNDHFAVARLLEILLGIMPESPLFFVYRRFDLIRMTVIIGVYVIFLQTSRNRQKRRPLPVLNFYLAMPFNLNDNMTHDVPKR